MYNNNIKGYNIGVNITDDGSKDLLSIENLEAFQEKIDKSDFKNSYSRYSTELVLLNKAIGKNLTCIFVDHGLLRKNTTDGSKPRWYFHICNYQY